MSTFVNNDVNDGDIVEASDHNTQGALLAAVINGNIDNANISASAAIAGSKLADSSVTSTKLDFGGSGAGVWWEEVGRTTLGSAGDTITVSSLPARKHLQIRFIGIASGQIRALLRFNSDTGNNYDWRSSVNGGADSTVSATSGIEITDAQSQDNFAVIDVQNVAAEQKSIVSNAIRMPAAGTAPGRVESVGKWTNTSNAISSVTITNTGTGDFDTGSEVVVLGHN